MASSAAPAEPSAGRAPASSAGRDLEQLVAIETPEQVVLSYTIAGIGSRSAAAILDTVLIATAILIVSMGRMTFMGHLAGASRWALAILVLASFAIVWGYFVLFEGLWDGQTPGKRQFGLRVVRDGGYSVGFAASAVRNLVRVIDMQPGFLYAVGMVSAVFSSTGKRLGDYAAGTMVVQERAVAIGAVSGPPLPDEGDGPIPTATLSDDEYALLDRYMARRDTLDAQRRVQLAEQLAARFRDRAPTLTGSDSAVLAALHAMERRARARGAAGHQGKGAARERHAIVARGGPRWQEFASLLTSAQRRGLRGMSEAEVSDFVARYRELASDLARLQTAARGRSSDSVFALSRLVAAGHNLLYRDARRGWRTAWQYMMVTVPQEIRRSVLPIALASALLYGPGLIAYVAIVRHPAVASELLPPTMIDRAEHGAEWERQQKGYVAIADSVRPATGSFIMSNNIEVATITFAGGIAFGVGTVLSLVTNGIGIGAALGLYQSKGILSLIVRFIAPHGVLELTAITFAGAAGLLLASAILIPGAVTRREALVERGRRAIRLIAATVLMLVVAGTLEGLVSPIPTWSLAEKLSVSAITAVLLLLYISLGRGVSDGTGGTIEAGTGGTIRTVG
jgi:uncharacterized membrane protein SpoIIM required for sporulation/uncharacterized RDD family membrane protein YckC